MPEIIPYPASAECERLADANALHYLLKTLTEKGLSVYVIYVAVLFVLTGHGYLQGVLPSPVCEAIASANACRLDFLLGLMGFFGKRAELVRVRKIMHDFYVKLKRNIDEPLFESFAEGA